MAEDSSTQPPSRRPWWRRTAVIIGAAGVLLAAAVTASVVTATQSARVEGPHYASLADPCTMVTTASMAKFAPGDAVDTIGTTSRTSTADPAVQQAANCSWDLPIGVLSVRVSLYHWDTGPASAQQYYAFAVRDYSNPGPAGTVTGARTVQGLGDQAKVIYSSVDSIYNTSLLVRSENAVFSAEYDSIGVPSTPAQLAAAIAVARNILTGLARPGSVPSARATPVSGQHYSKPANPCRLITAATLAKYLPGATATPGQPSGGNPGGCTWGGPAHNTGLILGVATFASASGQGGAQQDFEYDVQSDQGSEVTGQRSVTGLGDQATAIFQSRGSPQIVDLLVWSGNATISLELDVFSGGPNPAGQLAATIALARAILAALPRS